MNLAEFKRTMNGATLTLTESTWQGRDTYHKYLNVPRTVQVRSADMILRDRDGSESHMQYGKAANWTFTDSSAVFDDGGIRLVYRIGRV